MKSQGKEGGKGILRSFAFFLKYLNNNNNSLRILGWNKVDVMDQNISRIMPKVYADIHDKLMENYL